MLYISPIRVYIDLSYSPLSLFHLLLRIVLKSKSYLLDVYISLSENSHYPPSSIVLAPSPLFFYSLIISQLIMFVIYLSASTPNPSPPLHCNGLCVYSGGLFSQLLIDTLILLLFFLKVITFISQDEAFSGCHMSILCYLYFLSSHNSLSFFLSSPRCCSNIWCSVYYPVPCSMQVSYLYSSLSS